MTEREHAIEATHLIALELGRYIMRKDQSSFIWILDCLEGIEQYTGKGDKTVMQTFNEARNENETI